MQTFKDYLLAEYSNKNSGTAASYVTAIKIIDEIFQKEDIFKLHGKSLSDVRDPFLIDRIIHFIVEEEDKYRKGNPSIFDLGRPNQTSYPKKRFCTAAIRRLGDFVNLVCGEEAKKLMLQTSEGSRLSSMLINRFHIDDNGTEREVRCKRRVGQHIFRALLLDIYGAKCCISGLEIPEVIRASHIIPWAERSNTRLNPENGLCLSATYDAAFDQHLISLDENYKLILSPSIKDAYTSEAFKTYFLSFEGKQIALPRIYKPSQEFLEKHREKLVV